MGYTIEEAEEALRTARLRREGVENMIRLEVEAAAREIKELHRTTLEAATEIERACAADFRAAKDAIPDHPWTGKRVYAIKRTGTGYIRPEKRVEGVVEMRRSDTTFPANVRWGIPEIGKPFVRLLKADGTPSAKFDSWGMGGWRLVDGSES